MSEFGVTGLETPWDLVALVVGLVASLWAEYRRLGSRWPRVRVIAVVLLWLGLAAWALAPYRSISLSGQRVVWLTEEIQGWDSIAEAWGATQIWERQQGLALGAKLETRWVPDVWQAPDPLPDSILILGDDLPAQIPTHFPGWKHLSVRELNSRPLTGITRLVLPDQAQMGLPMALSGDVIVPPGGAQLVWKDLAGGLDSLQWDSAGSYPFRLQAFPRETGRFLHQLTWKTANDTLEEPLPIQIAPLKPLDVLVLAEFPTFEDRALKNWLGQSGHRVALRSRLAKERFRSEFINRPRANLDRLNAKVLAGYQLLIVDAQVLANLATAEQRAIQTAIREQGLGLLIQANEAVRNQPMGGDRQRFFYPWNLVPTGQSEGVFRKGSEEAKLTIWPYSHAEAVALWQGCPPTILVAPQGAGKVALHRAQDTHSLRLQGKTDLYDQYWATLINRIAGSEPKAEAWLSPRNLAFEQQPYQLTLISPRELPHAQTLDNDPVILVQDAYVPERWKGHGKSGQVSWIGHVLQDQPTDTAWVYALPDTTWLPLRQWDRQQAWALAEQAQSEKGMERQATTTKPLSPWWFWGLVLACLTFLWVEPKL